MNEPLEQAAHLSTLWCVWQGTPLRLGWQGPAGRASAHAYHEFAWASARRTLADRSPTRSPGYEALLQARLEQMRWRLKTAHADTPSLSPLDIFTEEEIAFYFSALAQLILLGVVASDDEHSFIELVAGPEPSKEQV